jgi:hypothetical protein
MAAIAEPTTTTPAPGKFDRPRGSLRFDWLMLVVGLWPLVGALTDANAHINDPKLETFLTPWHALLYSGVLAVGVAIGYVAWRNHQRGYAWTRAVPPGYGLTLVGVGILGVAGIGDLIWHSLFGIERDIPAIVSPTHMLIILGILLVVAGPLRSAYTRPVAEVRGLAQLPMILSVLLTYTMLTLPLQYLHPFSYRWAAFGNVDIFADRPFPAVDSYLSEGLGLASVLVTSAVLMGIVLFVVRRWQLIFGALTLILTVNIAVLGALQRDFSLVPAAFATGLLGDLLILTLRPSPGRANLFRLFAFALPVIFFTSYFVTLFLTSQVVWVIHLWTGSIIVAGAVGWAISYLVVPPREYVETAAQAQRPDSGQM